LRPSSGSSTIIYKGRSEAEGSPSHLKYKFVILLLYNVMGGLGSVVDIATAYGLEVRGSNPGGARFFAPVQTGPEAHPSSCTMGTGSFPGLRCCRGVTLTPHPLLVHRSKIE